MKSLIFVLALCIPVLGIAKDHPDIEKTAKQFCTSNVECVDLITMELEGFYHQGLNEGHDVTIGTHINRKARSLISYCEYSRDKKTCETYKAQLMLKYMNGLLDRK